MEGVVEAGVEVGVVLDEGDWMWLNPKQTKEGERDAPWIEAGVESGCLFGPTGRKIQEGDHLKLSRRICWGVKSFLVSSKQKLIGWWRLRFFEANQKTFPVGLLAQST